MIKHLTASTFVLFRQSECRIVLLHHKRFKKWMIPGGHVESWENPFEAAKREVREETGLNPHFVTFERAASHVGNSVPHPEFIVEEKIPAIGNDPEHIHIDCLYLALADAIPLTPRVGETMKLKAFTIDELVSLDMFDQTRELAQSFMTSFTNGRDLWLVTDGSKLRSDNSTGCLSH